MGCRVELRELRGLMGLEAVCGFLDSGLLGGESRTVGERARLALKREGNNLLCP